MSTTLEAIPGAVVEDGILLHRGDPVAEQRLLAAGQAVAPLNDRAVVRVGGPDRLSWLDSITSQALTALPPGASTELLVLDPQGHVEHAAAVADDGESAWLIVDALDAPALAAWLTRMRFRLRVEIESRDDLRVIGAHPDAAASVNAYAPAGVPLIWHDPWPGVSVGGHGYALGEHPGSERPWVEIIVSADEWERLLEEAANGTRPLSGTWAVEAERVAAWRPRWSHEVDERTLPHEVDWLRTAVHLSKGCYRGQETVAKVHNLGHPPRRIVAVHLDGSGSELPAPGDELRIGDEVIGQLTSVARHREDGPIALAVVRRNAPLGDAVVMSSAGPVAAAIEPIVPADAGATASIPRLTRLSRRAPAPDPRRET